MRKMSQRRQHLLDTIRASELPISTKELWDTCPRDQQGWLPGYTNVYADLRALEYQGYIECVRLDGHKSVYWRRILDPAEAYRIGAEIEQLERIWASS